MALPLPLPLPFPPLLPPLALLPPPFTAFTTPIAHFQESRMHMVASVIWPCSSLEVASPKHLWAFSFSSLSSKHSTTAPSVSMFSGAIAEISVPQAATPFGQYWVAQALAASSPAWLLKSISAEKHLMQSAMVWLLPKFSAVQRRMLPGSIFSFFLLPPCCLRPPLAGTASAVAARESRMKAFILVVDL